MWSLPFVHLIIVSECMIKVRLCTGFTQMLNVEYENILFTMNGSGVKKKKKHN